MILQAELRGSERADIVYVAELLYWDTKDYWSEICNVKEKSKDLKPPQIQNQPGKKENLGNHREFKKDKTNRYHLYL